MMIEAEVGTAQLAAKKPENGIGSNRKRQPQEETGRTPHPHPALISDCQPLEL